ncbi:MAG: hypothetical protein WC022_04300 [Parcubacteria group bacterium]
MRLPSPTKNNLLIFYKLLGDLLFLLLVFFTLALIADGLLLGIVSSHISFLKIIVIITLGLAAFYATGYAADVRLAEEHPNKKTTIFLTVVVAILIFNSLFKINHYLALFILLVTLVCIFFLNKLFFEKLS